MSLYKNYTTKLTFEQYDTKVTLEKPNSDTTIDEVLELFKGAALAMGYSETGWNRAVFEYCEENTDSDTTNGITEEMLDEAFAQHNAHEEGFDIDFDNKYKVEE